MVDPEHEIEYLAKTIFGEARDQPEVGQIAVGHVILNRVRAASNLPPSEKSAWGGDSIQGVVTCPHQFECWNKGDVKTHMEPEIYRRIRTLASEIYNGKTKNPIGICCFYNNPLTDNGGRDPDWVIKFREQGIGTKDIGVSSSSFHRFYYWNRPTI